MNTRTLLIITTIIALLGGGSVFTAYQVLNEPVGFKRSTWNVVDENGKRICFSKELEWVGDEADPIKTAIVWYDNVPNKFAVKDMDCFIDETAERIQKDGGNVVYMELSERGKFRAAM